MNDFDSQFKTKKQIRFFGRSISFMDVVPTNLVSEIPIFIAPGWGETPRTFKDLSRLLFDAGFRVISVAYPRQDLKLITKNNISKLEFQKAEIILAVFEFLGITKTNTVAHSEGAINAVIAAHIQSTLFANIILVGPGGLVNNEGFIELVGRYIGYLIRGGVRAIKEPSLRSKLVRSGIETFKYFLMNPVMSLLEGSAISKTHLEAFLIELHDRNISICIIQGLDDIVFPIEKMKNLTDLKWIDFKHVSGDHHDIYACPQNYVLLIKDKLIK